MQNTIMKDGINEKTDKKSKHHKKHKKSDSEEVPEPVTKNARQIMFEKFKERSKSVMTKIQNMRNKSKDKSKNELDNSPRHSSGQKTKTSSMNMVNMTEEDTNKVA